MASHSAKWGCGRRWEAQGRVQSRLASPRCLPPSV